ncbi:spindle and kinetochore-associated protein 1 [Xyrichtys novacula]|uniref:SKA complex subunit 1 n=1 Tax=Xyrichtys novacula TaxID=13765 RepID=A0AAV1F8T8_XYRNO|nr:spindle and kinetochore-associated protein 1 [Xyrichtys novacula]
MWTNSQHGPRTSTPRARHGDGLKQRNGAVIGDGVEELQGRRALKSADTQSHGQFFVVEEDIRDFTQVKVDKRFQKIFIMLRHCGRLREVRGGGLTRYMLL